MSSNVQDRDWFVDANPMYVDDEETLGQALSDVITILTRIGGGFVIAAHRKEVAPDNWMTVGYHVRWSSFVPGDRFQEPEQSAPEPEPATV